MTGPLSSGHFRYLFLHVVDLEEMLRFYRDRLGLVVSYHEKDLCAFLRLRADDPFDLALFVGRESPTGAEPDRFPAIDVASLDDAVAELRRRGVDVGEITETAIGRYVKLHDPEGNVVEIHQGNAS